MLGNRILRNKEQGGQYDERSSEHILLGTGQAVLHRPGNGNEGSVSVITGISFSKGMICSVISSFCHKLFSRFPNFDMVLMDIRTPEMNGLDATRVVRETDRDVPFIAPKAYAQVSGRKIAMLENILKLGHPGLYKQCKPVRQEEVAGLESTVNLMAGCITSFRETYGSGRAIAAPQVGKLKRLIVLNIDRPVAIYNPVLYDLSREMIELWDDCMSFPDLLVRVRRHKSLKMRFRDSEWQEQTWELEGDMSELLQHEYDHLDGILATMRAIDQKSFRWRTG
jgi:peptide deformylase